MVYREKQYNDTLCHFNPNHDPRTGRFAKGSILDRLERRHLEGKVAKAAKKESTRAEALERLNRKRYSKEGSLARIVGEAKRNQAAESYARNTSAPRATMTDISGSINASYREASESRAKNAPRATITDDQRIQLAYKKASAARGSGSPRANATVDQLIQLAYSKASEGTAKGSPRASAKNFDIFKEKLNHPISTGLNWIKHKFNTTSKEYPQHTVYL